MRTLWESLLGTFAIFQGTIEQFAAGRHASVAERAVTQDRHVSLRNHKRAFTLVFQHARHIHNRYNTMVGSVLTPLQRLRKNQHKPHQTYVFGATVLTSGPPAKSESIVGRFAYGAYLG